MRMDEYQKWLESQFEDEPETLAAPVVEAVAVEVEAIADEPAVAPVAQNSGSIEDDSISHQPELREPLQREILQHAPPVTVEAEDQPSLPEIPAEAAPIPSLVAEDASQHNWAPSNEVPSLERYFPHILRPDSKRPQQIDPAADAASPEPAHRTPPPTDARIAPARPIPVPESNISDLISDVPPARHRKITLATRRARHARNVPAQKDTDGPIALWTLVPKHIQVLVSIGSGDVAQNSYTRKFKESRIELINRLLDPTLSLEDTARLLDVCPTTVRRYTNRGLLTHQRTAGDQRRFKLSDVLTFLESQSTSIQDSQ